MRQTHDAWVAEVVNDDPEDGRVAALIGRLGDSRIRLSSPAQRRGGTGNFNHAFRTVTEPFASILEDDNWWEPAFLATMLDAISRHPEVTLACGNERIWREEFDGTWTDTGTAVWSSDRGEALFAWNALDKCGDARLCNSSLLFRTAGAERWQTPPEIPIEVTEHFRERVVPHPFLLVFKPLVNFSQTLATYRSRDARIWNSYQMLLVGSVFALAHPAARAGLADALWRRARDTQPLSAAALLAAGWFFPEASELWWQSQPWEKLRFFARQVRHPRNALALWGARAEHRHEWEWLLRGPFAEFMANTPR